MSENFQLSKFSNVEDFYLNKLITFCNILFKFQTWDDFINMMANIKPVVKRDILPDDMSWLAEMDKYEESAWKIIMEFELNPDAAPFVPQGEDRNHDYADEMLSEIESYEDADETLWEMEDYEEKERKIREFQLNVDAAPFFPEGKYCLFLSCDSEMWGLERGILV